MKITPLFSRVIIKPLKTETIINGIHVPDTAIKNKNEAIIHFVPIGCELEQGDKIIYEQCNMMEIAIEGEQYYILDKEHIIAKYDTDNN